MYTEVYIPVQYKCTEGFVQKQPVDHASLPNEETKEVKKELDEINKKFDEARGIKFEVNYRVVRFSDHGDLSSKKKLLQMMKQVKMIKLPLLKLWSVRTKVSLKSSCVSSSFVH